MAKRKYRRDEDMDTSIFRLKIPDWLLETINVGLQNLPYKTAAPAIAEINRQIGQFQLAQRNVPDKKA